MGKKAGTVQSSQTRAYDKTIQKGLGISLKPPQKAEQKNKRQKRHIKTMSTNLLCIIGGQPSIGISSAHLEKPLNGLHRMVRDGRTKCVRHRLCG